VLWDPDHRAAALAHAGWRGTEAEVAAHTVQAMRREFGTDPSALKAGIGPGICGRCYEVGEEVATRFDARFVSSTNGDRFLLDLASDRPPSDEQGPAGCRPIRAHPLRRLPPPRGAHRPRRAAAAGPDRGERSSRATEIRSRARGRDRAGAVGRRPAPPARADG